MTKVTKGKTRKKTPKKGKTKKKKQAKKQAKMMRGLDGLVETGADVVGGDVETAEKPPRATKFTPDEELTPEQLYQRNYYREKKAERAKAHAERWAKDKEYREREIQRQRDKRQEEREAVALERFNARVEEKRAKAKLTRRPKFVELSTGERTYVYGTGSMAREVGREDATIRSWLVNGILPGASIWIGRRAHFTPEFIGAVRDACKRMLCEDGRGDNDRFTELVCEALESAQIHYESK